MTATLAKQFGVKFALELQLYLPLSAAKGMKGACACGAAFDSRGYHLLSCSCTYATTKRHTEIVNCFARVCKIMGITVEVEPEDRFPGTDVRPDLEYPYLRNGGRTDADVTVVTALHGNAGARANAATVDGWSARRAERAKRAHYAAAGLGNIAGASLFPLVFEQGGRMGAATKAFLRLLAQYGQDSGWAPRWFFYWSQAAKLNAALIEGNYKKVVAVRRHNLRMQHRGRAAMAGTGEASWPHSLHGEGGVHQHPLGDDVAAEGGAAHAAPVVAAAPVAGGGAAGGL